MFLKSLMQGEKFAFYSIAKYLVSIDGEYSAEEQNLMNGFLQEMELNESQISHIKPEDAIEMLTFSSPSTRRKIYIELIGVTLCDEYLHDDERKYLDRIANDFLIDEDTRNKLFDLVTQLLNLYKSMHTLVDV
ncbi:MAG: TerB family tellurite resistance protein [Lachnospiraceae bacterium]|nr:TerB family tellurite resistance protein [Lachnospiraceae bacterium]